MKLLFLFISVMMSTASFAQNSNDSLIQFTGNVLTVGSDSLEILPFVLVKNISRNSGSYSGLNGYFSVVVKRGDTVEFSSVGYKTSKLIIPQDIENNKLFASQIMIRQSHRLPEAIIVPWKNVEELKKAFVDLELTEDDLVTAYQNLQYNEVLSESLAPSASEAQSMTLQNQRDYNALYSHGVMPQNNLLNPVAWYQFIKSLSDGKKKKKKATFSKEP
jgi:signal peptidase I